MTIENEVTDPQLGSEGAPTPEDNLETIAREMGWKPESEWKGEPPAGGFASPADYIRSQKAHSKNLEKEIRKLKTDTDKRIQRMEQQSVKQREKEINDLHAEYDYWIKKAVKAGDEGRYEALTKERDEKVKEAKDEAKRLKEEEGDTDLDEDTFIEQFKPSYPEVQKRFYNDGHAWVLDEDADPDAMRLVLDYVDSGVPFADALEKADKALRRAYPEQYDDEEEEEDPKPKNGKRMPVLAPGGRGNGGHVSAASRLSPAQREIGNRFVKEGLFASLEEYAEQRLKLDA